jgi:hypothetical protein
MEDGDLATWEGKRILLVLENTCCQIVYHHRIRRHKQPTPMDADDWDWSLITVKTIQRYAYNSVPVEIITFVSQEVADLAAEWFQRYDVEVANVTYYDFKTFCRSLTWRRNNIQEVIDTQPDRLEHYGQFGRQILFGAGF